jgi:hypothetical protein
MRTRLHRALLLGAATLTACGRGGERAPADTAAQAPIDTVQLARARRAADALGGDLVKLLTTELERGGPEAAIAVCADSAQVRTRRHSVDGVTVRRVGTRVRNPANAPDSVEQAVLAAFATALSANRQMPDTAFVQVAVDGSRELRYMRAVRVQEMCLACHGPPDAFARGVRRVLRERYPEDQATGYAVGELRGAVSVRVGGAP